MKYGGKREDGQKKARRCKFCVQHIIKSVENVKKKPLNSLFKSKKVKKSIKQRRMLSRRSLKMR